jgi:hypothetical protein
MLRGVEKFMKLSPPEFKPVNKTLIGEARLP